MLGQLPWQEESDGSLDLSGGNGGPLVILSQATRLSCQALEYVVHKRVHDRHRLGGHPSVRMDLFQNLIDVNSVRFLPLLSFLLSLLTSTLFRGTVISRVSLSRLFHRLARWFGRHFV